MRSLMVVVCLFVFALAAFAQGDRGTITGTIADPAGAVVANAQVEGRNLETGSHFPVTTTATGIYTLSQLPVGTYEVTVTVPGFKKFVRQGLRVEVAQTLGVDITLEVGQTSESVTVSGEASLLKTESSDVSHNVTVITLNELPMLGTGPNQSGSSGIRNPNNVTGLVPGTYYVPNSQVKVNGAPSNSQAYHVEGMDSSNQMISFAPAQLQPSVDAIQEVSIQTSSYAPEFGTVGGGFYNVSMRSGGNQYHGSGYDYFVNEVLNAAQPFTGPPFTNTQAGELVRPVARRHDYGWTIGGPVSIPKIYNGHDRTFFFFNFEQFRETQFINNSAQTVPTLAYRNGDFSGAINAVKAGGNLLTTDKLGRPVYQNEIYDPATQFVGTDGSLLANPFLNNTIDPARFDKVAVNVQKLVPTPNLTGFNNNFLPVYPSIRHTTIPAVKFDQNIGSRGKLSFYWSFTHTDSQFSPIYGNSDGLPVPITEARGTFIHSHVERLNYDHTLSPTLLLHIGVGYQQNNFFDDAPVLDYDASSALGLAGATVKRNFPNFGGFCPLAPLGTTQCSNAAAGGLKNLGASGSIQSHSYLEKPAGNISLAWVKGSHTYKFGGEMRLEGYPIIPYNNTNGNYQFSFNETGLPYLVASPPPGGSIGFGYASFLLGLVDNFQIAAPSEVRVGKKQIAFFAQDSWKVSRKLTFDYGVRYDYGTYAREQYGRGINLSLTTPNPNAGGAPGGTIFEGSAPGRCNCDFAKNYPWAFGPRVGGAYQITPKTVFRAGWGLVYNQTNYLPAATAANNQVFSTGLGAPTMQLQSGIPAKYIPTWPVFNAGIFPVVPGQIYNPVLGINIIDQNAGRPARQNQWNVGIQRELGRDIVVEASYVANRGVWWSGLGANGLANINALTPQFLLSKGIDINNPTDLTLLTSALSTAAAINKGFKAPYAGFPLNASVAQSLRPFPQFGTINDQGAPLGKTWYDSLQVKGTKRLSHGLQFTTVFTWQKSLQEGVDSNLTLNNILANKDNAKSLSSFDQPRVLVVSGSYQVPKVGGNKVLSWIVREWQMGAILTYSSGLPIATPVTTNTLNTQLFQQTLANRVAGQPLYNVPDLNCHCYDPATTFVLNKNAWANPVNGQFSNSAEFYNDFRYQRHPGESINFGRNFRFKERYSLNIRADFSNIFNRTYYNNPSNAGFATPTATNPVTHLNSSGFGYINLTMSPTGIANTPRAGIIVARFTF